MTKTQLTLLTTGLLAACGGSSAKTATTTSAAPSGPIYMALFQDGAHTFSVVTTTSGMGDDGEPSKETSQAETMTCTIAGAHQMGALWMSTMTCAAGEDASPTGQLAPEGVWAANDKGLWWFGADDPAGKVMPPAMDDVYMLIGATASAHKKEIPGDHEEDGSEYVFSEAGAAGAWCFGYSMAAGDEAGWKMCMAADKGIVSGNWFTAGGTSIDHDYVAK